MPNRSASDDRLRELFAATGIARGFLADRPIARGVVDGAPGVFLTVRLTSYRSLPLSCIEAVEIAIDGAAVAPDGLRLIVDNVPYRLGELKHHADRWWFILDFATLFVPAADLPGGAHHVSATLVTVEPYMTAGRFSMHNPDDRSLTVEEAA